MVLGLQLWEIVGTILILVIVVFLLRTSHLPLPPGPTRSLFVGNALQLPKIEPWKTYRQWGKQFGPLVYLRVFTRHIVVLNTASASVDLLEKRSNIYSDRPQPYMLHELAGRKLSVFMITSENERFRLYRRMLHAELNTRVIPGYKSLMEDEARSLLTGLLQHPERFMRLIRLNAGAIIMKLAYGYTVKSDDDFFITTIEKVFALNAKATGFWLVDYFPILRFIPSWFPGGGFKRAGRGFKIEMDKMGDVPHDWVKKQLTGGDFVESFTSRQLRSEDGGELSREQEDIVKYVAAALYAGGADTVASSLTTFFLVMSLHPKIQRRAQAEIDEVIGRERLPELEDYQRGKLPYVNAVIKEVFRWHPVVPLGLPHMVKNEDTYNGYRIPAGSVVLANIWAIMHDETIYPEPFVFDPERHLPPAGKTTSDHVLPPDPADFVFGFGRRICAGSDFARASLFLTITSILSCFHISKALDKYGQEIEPLVEFSTGTTSHAKPFECRITPRADAEMLISRS